MATIIRQSYIDKIERYLGKETVIVSSDWAHSVFAFEPQKSLMTENDRDLNDRIHEYMNPYTPWGSLLVMSKLPKFVLGRYRIVLNIRYLFLGVI